MKLLKVEYTVKISGGTSKNAIAKTLGIGSEEVTIINSKFTTFPNSCLGLQNEFCSPVITPGSIVLARVGIRPYVFHVGKGQALQAKGMNAVKDIFDLYL